MKLKAVVNTGLFEGRKVRDVYEGERYVER